MSTSVSLNGVSYVIPATGEDNWGTAVSSYLIATSTGLLSKAGGAFTLTAEADFGATYGLKSTYFKSRGTVSTVGSVRLANDESMSWRNAANSANLSLKVNTSNVLEFNGNPISALALGAANTVLKMNAGGTATEYGLLANANIDASAEIVYSKLSLADSIVNADINSAAEIAYSKLSLTGSIVNADVNASAAIALTKLAASTASRALVSDGSGFITAATTTATEIGYVNGVTSAIQTQINTKASLASPTFTGTVLLQNVSGAQPELHLSEDPDNGTNVVKIKAPAALGADYTLTLPTDDGNSGQTLTTDGSGGLSWASPFTNPMTTTGDIVYSSDGSGTPARLAIGASTTVLVGGTTPSWAQIANAQVSAAAAIAGTKISPAFGSQNITTTGNVVLNTNAIVLDTANQRIGVGISTPTVSLDVVNSSAGQNLTRFLASETGNAFTGKIIQAQAHRTASSGYYFITCDSDADGTPDTEFLVQGNGVVASDGGTAMSTPADYAEMFEWVDGNPNNEDRVGRSVILENGKIREAIIGEVPIGVISGNPAVLGDAAWNKWSGKYLKDDFNRYLVDENDNRILNPNFDPNVPYTPRQKRKEWAPVGLLGKLNVIVGQAISPNWIKLEDISLTVERWLVK